MIDKYIKLSQALEVLDACACWWAHERMERIPAADVVERKRGKWREDMWLTTEGYSCSECNCFTANSSKFCPNCGADMRELPKEVGT